MDGTKAENSQRTTTTLEDLGSCTLDLMIGEYLTTKGVKILIQDKKIVNIVPRHLQTPTTIYPDLPTASEMSSMLHLSNTVKAAAQLTVMDELCNQAQVMKEDLADLEKKLQTSLLQQVNHLKTFIMDGMELDLEKELKTYIRRQLVQQKKDFQEEMQKFYTALLDDRVLQLP